MLLLGGQCFVVVLLLGGMEYMGEPLALLCPCLLRELDAPVLGLQGISLVFGAC